MARASKGILLVIVSCEEGKEGLDPLGFSLQCTERDHSIMKPNEPRDSYKGVN